MNTNTDEYDMDVRMGGSAFPTDQRRNLQRWLSVITGLVAFAAFTEAVFAGAMLSGVDWARRAHSVNAAVFIASAVIASLICVITRRRIPGASKLGLTLLLMAAVVVVQAATGALSAKGANLLWVHIPLGVALFGFAVRAAAGARRLGRAE